MNQPVKTFKDKGLQIAIWETKNGGYSYSISKRFKDKVSGDWKDSKYFFKSDLEALAPLLELAIGYSADRTAPAEAAIASPSGFVSKSFEDDDIPF